MTPKKLPTTAPPLKPMKDKEKSIFFPTTKAKAKASEEMPDRSSKAKDNLKKEDSEETPDRSSKGKDNTNKADSEETPDRSSKAKIQQSPN